MTDSNGAHDSLVLERTLDAPVELVWQMWTDPEHFKAWYGPDGASIPVAELDVRVGGPAGSAWRSARRTGRCGWFTGEHLEIDRPVRLVYTESMTDEHGSPMSPDGHPAATEVHIELEAVAGKTLMRLTHVGIPAGSPGAAGWTMALDKLTAHLQAAVRRSALSALLDMGRRRGVQRREVAPWWSSVGTSFGSSARPEGSSACAYSALWRRSRAGASSTSKPRGVRV